MRGAERERLIKEYHQAVKNYSEAVSRLLHLEGPEFDRAYQQVEQLHKISEQCRAAFEKLK